MARSMKNPRIPTAFVSSTLGATLVCITAAWVAASAVAPVVMPPDTAKTEQTQFRKQSARPHFRLSPVPAGADWTS